MVTSLAVTGWLRSRIEPVELFLRILLGGFFCVAAAGKIADPMLFESAIRNFSILADPWIAWAAMSIPPFELIAGACVILRLLYPGCVIALGVALVGFLASLASLMARGIDTECGCLGIATTIQLQIFIDSGLVAAALGLMWMWRKDGISKKQGG